MKLWAQGHFVALVEKIGGFVESGEAKQRGAKEKVEAWVSGVNCLEVSAIEFKRTILDRQYHSNSSESSSSM